MQRLLGKLTYSNVVSSICLVLVLGGGTAFAAAKLGKNSVGTKQLKAGSVTGGKIAAGAINGEKVENDSLTGADIKNSTLGTVPTADTARTATTANSAQTAASATTAQSAETAKTADSAKTAQSAATADKANIAISANSAQTAGSANSAQTAKSAETASKATVAEGLTGRSAFTYFTEAERQVYTTYPFTVTLRCTVEGQDRKAAMVVDTQEESTLLTAGSGAESVQPGVPFEILTTEGKAGAKEAEAGDDVTVVSPGGAAFTIAAPTVGVNLDGNHAGQCFFSGVLEDLKALPAAP